MQVFKTFFKIAKKYRGSTIMYILIFMSIVLTIAANKDNSSVEDFQTSTIDVAVFDHDNSALSKGLVKYLEGHQKLVTIEENSDSFKDNLYSRKVEYILIIPEGFSKNIANSSVVNLLESYKFPSSMASEFLDMQINKFISVYQVYLASFTDKSVAYNETISTLSLNTKVTLSEKVDDTPASFSFYRYMPYILLSIISLGITPILIVFNKIEMKKRTLVSCVSQLSRNFSLGFASLIYTLGIFFFFTITSIIIYKSEMFSLNGVMLISNMFIHILICLSFSFFMSQIVTSQNVLNMITNIVGLGSSFLSGVFVPKEFLSSGVLTVGKFFPAYWYLDVQEAFLETSNNTSTIINGFMIQLLFAIALFVLGMAASQKRQ